MPKPDFEGCRNDIKKTHQEEQYPLCLGEHQMPNHPSTFMKMIKGSSQAISAANDERRQVLRARVIWDGSIDRFKVFRNNAEGHYGQIGAGYLFDTDFQTAYLEKEVDCYVDFMDEVPTASQIKKDARALCGALLSACQDTDGNRNVRIKKLENVIKTVFHRHYKGEGGCLNGNKIMKMHSQNFSYLAKLALSQGDMRIYERIFKV